MLENLLFWETNGVPRKLLMASLYFIIQYVILANHINFQLLVIESTFYSDFQSFSLINSL